MPQAADGNAAANQYAHGYQDGDESPAASPNQHADAWSLTDADSWPLADELSHADQYGDRGSDGDSNANLAAATAGP